MFLRCILINLHIICIYFFIARNSQLVCTVRPVEAHVRCTLAGSLKRNWTDGGTSWLPLFDATVERMNSPGGRTLCGGAEGRRGGLVVGGGRRSGQVCPRLVVGWFLSALQLFCL